MFEALVGWYYPTIGAMRTAAIPDEGRATVLTASKLFYNAIVVAVCLNMKYLSNAATFGVCVGLLTLGLVSQILLRVHQQTQKRGGFVAVSTVANSDRDLDLDLETPQSQSQSQSPLQQGRDTGTETEGTSSSE